MGNFLSGWHRGRRGVVEDYMALDVVELARAETFAPGREGGWHWERTDTRKTLASVSFRVGLRGEQLVLDYVLGSPGKYAVPIEWTPCNFGGTRPWFRCPAKDCTRRVRFLYQVNGVFICRRCSNLTYWSRQIHRNLGYEAGRISRMLEALRSRGSRTRSPARRAKFNERIRNLQTRERAIMRKVAHW
jgi:hypothetical protein